MTTKLSKKNKEFKKSSLKNKNVPKSKLKTIYNSSSIKRDSGKYGIIHFLDYPEFKPNLTPKEILTMGSFGGTYFRPIHSKITNKSYNNIYNEFPKSWFSNLDINTYICSEKCNPKINKYGVAAGSSLKSWESSGWIKTQDPYGWFQWYCRFYNGRRSDDDERQIKRWDNYAGKKKGRWRRNLIKKCKDKGAKYDDETISPVIRQGLQQWAYILTANDLK